MKKAYDNWSQVVEYDGKSLLSFKQLNNSSQNEVPVESIDYSNAFDQMAPQHFPGPSQLSAMDPNLLMPGKHIHLS